MILFNEPSMETLDTTHFFETPMFILIEIGEIHISVLFNLLVGCHLIVLGEKY